MNTRRQLLLAAGSSVLLWSWPSQAQNPGAIRRLGLLVTGTQPDAINRKQLNATVLQRLQELGWTVDGNLIVDYRSAGGQLDRLPQLAHELVDAKADVIFTSGAAFTLDAARQATSTVPIVMAGAYPDNVAAGVIQSLARPGGNVTGMTFSSGEIPGKRLQLLKEVIPRLSRVGFLAEPGTLGQTVTEEQTNKAARSLKLEVVRFYLRYPSEFEGVLQEARKARVQALMVSASTLFSSENRYQLAELLIKYKFPTSAGWDFMADAGFLMGYSASVNDLYRDAAVYIDKIFRGAKPADLPVAEPTRYYLVINLKTAKALNVKIPQSVLVRADRVIE